MTHAAYTDLKAAYHLTRVQDLRDGRLFTPPHVQLIISDLCNQDCAFCAYRVSSGFSSEHFGVRREDGTLNMNPPRMIPYEKCEEILRDCAASGVKAIQFTGGGEPTAHPRHMDIFRLALDLGLKCGLVTNGAILRAGWESTLPRFDWIRVSLDAGSAKTYGKIRRVPEPMFSKVLTHTNNIALAIDRTKTLLGVGFVVTPDNYREIEFGAEVAKATGAAYIRVSASFSREFDEPYRRIYDHIKAMIASARDMTQDDRFQVVDLFGDRIDDLKQHAPDYALCGYQHFNTYIGGDLKVYRCCNTAYTSHGEVASLENQSFAKYLASPERKERVQSFDARSCQVCQFNNKNRVIAYLAGDAPLHVEFV